jgi:GDP-L-fucose synthase
MDPTSSNQIVENQNNRVLRALVTGGTGLIGRQVVKKLKDLGFAITTVSLDAISVEGSDNHIEGDLTNFDFCMEMTKGVDYVFHLAGIKGSLEVTLSRPASFLVPMLRFNTNVLEASRRNGVQKLVYTSSIGAYASAEVFVETHGNDGEPMDTYPGWAKRMAETQIQAYKKEYGLDWAVVRPCNVYGPGDNFDPNNAMVIPSLMMKIRRGDSPVTVWGDGSSIRDFAYSEDVAEGIVKAAEVGTRGSFVNLGSGRGYSIAELVSTLLEFISFEVEFDSTKPSGFPKRVMDISRAKDWLGYSPKTTLREGLEKTWSWFLENEQEYLLKKNYFSDKDS